MPTAKRARTVRAFASCAALDMNGNGCGREAVRTVQYHGDQFLYGTFNEPWPGWVRVKLCAKHSVAPATRTRKPRKETR